MLQGGADDNDALPSSSFFIRLGAFEKMHAAIYAILLVGEGLRLHMYIK